MPDVVLWSSAKKKPEPQLYESIQSQTFFDIIGKINEEITKNTVFPLDEKEKKMPSVLDTESIYSKF